MESTTTSPLEAACKAVNGTTELARLLSKRKAPRHVSKASVSRWKKEGVPAEICPDIEALTGVRCEELRPDVNWSVLRKKAKVG
jgi:DNA-binding transcriptional regulator YdaS (Cro superfamily)